MSRFDVPKGALISRVAESLKKLPDMKPPSWAAVVKTGAHNERPPADSNWWFVRSAAVLRRVADRGPVGVAKLRKMYGGKKNRGMKPERFAEGSGNILRKVLQQLEKSRLVKQVVKGVHKGRVLTPEGQKVLDGAARELMKESNTVLPKAVHVPVEEKKVEEKPKKKRAPRKKVEQKK